MGEAYPELNAQKDIIEKVMVEEETSFLRTLETGIRLLDKVVEQAQKAGKKEIDGKTVFVLYDTVHRRSLQGRQQERGHKR